MLPSDSKACLLTHMLLYSKYTITNPHFVLFQISIQALANAIDVPVWIERQTVDLKICMYDRLYQDTIIVNNR